MEEKKLFGNLTVKQKDQKPSYRKTEQSYSKTIYRYVNQMMENI